MFIADQGNHAVRRVDPGGIITTVAGPGELSAPYGLTFDLARNLVICDSGNFRVVRLNSTTGMIETIVGSGLSSPRDVAFDGSGNLYITDAGAQRVWRWDPGRPATLHGGW